MITKLPEGLRVAGWLVRDTFRQAVASGICWLLLGVSTLSILVCLSVSVVGDVKLAKPDEQPDFLPRTAPEAKDKELIKRSAVTVVDGDLRLAFGALRIPLARDARSAVHLLELILAGGVADTLGLLLTLVWTAGFLPGFLDGRSVPVLLAKPTPRWCLLLGKYVGVLSFVFANAVLFVGGTWLAIGLKTGVWDTAYWLSVPLLLLHFAIFFSGSLVLAVCTRSTVVSVFGSIAFWILCWGMNYGRHAATAATKLAPESQFSQSLIWLADLGYWILPKPADLGMLVYDALGGRDYFQPLFAPGLSFSFGLSILSSLVFTGWLLWIATKQFESLDY
jgi:ABC-type transport system involved in multi-copper enzyme maturation permease subunit